MTKFTLFYGGFCSQWHRCNFEVNGVRYNCAEQYMMAEKARFFGDREVEKKIMQASHPKEQKRLGRLVKNFNRHKWDAVARDVVYRGNYAKFSQNSHLAVELKNTTGTLLVEASPYDKIWGIGRSKSDPKSHNQLEWLGTNWLGEVLTKVRDDLINEVETTENYGWE